MEVVICHLTRMKAPYICIAGMEPETGKHIRPVLPKKGQLDCGMLDCHGGCVNMAKVIEMGPVKDAGAKPEVEDRLFNPGRLRAVRTLKLHEFWGMLLVYSKDSLEDIFGDDLQPRKQSFVVQRNSGNASLGLLLPRRAPNVVIKELGGKKRIRVMLTEKGRDLDLSLTDLRFYRDDLTTPLDKAVAVVAKKLRNGVRSILSVGLTRPFAANPGEPEYHWLQVNNIHMQDDPAWQVNYDGDFRA